MQEEVENRTLTLVVSGTKFTGRLLKAAISKYMAHCKEKKLQKQRSRDAPVTPHGKQTVKQLIGQNQGISNIEITDPSIKEFEKIARKYGVDYAVKKDRSSSPETSCQGLFHQIHKKSKKRCQKHCMAPDTSFNSLHFSVQQVFTEIRIVWQLVDIWLPAPLDFRQFQRIGFLQCMIVACHI